MKKLDIDYIKAAGAKAKGKRPYFFDDPAVERILSITMAVAGELAVVRERLDSLERILEKKDLLTMAEVEKYEPDDASAEERQQWHAEYIARILRIIQQEMEALEDESLNADLEEVAQELSHI